MKVLILSGRFGFGHEMAANAVREEFKRQDDSVEIIQKDLPSYFFPHLSKIVYKVFGMVAERYHRIYNLVYKMSERMNSGEKPGGPLIFRMFQKMMEEYTPDVIVCTHPFCEKAAATYKAKTGSQIPLVTCITDISVSMEWFSWQTDIYLVPTVEIKDHLLSLGIMPENVLVTGIPVRQQFLKKQEPEIRACRRYIHETIKCRSDVCNDAGKESSGEIVDNNSKRQILIMGGGLGIMPELEDLIYTLHEIPNVRTTVITGNNQKLYETWTGRFKDVEVLGYVENIGTYMRQADLVITKAGGITLFELIHSQVPMFIIHPFLEQEIANARYAQGKGFAKVIWDKQDDFTAELKKILEETDGLEEMRRCMVKAHREMMDTSLEEAVWEMRRQGLHYMSAFSFAGFNRKSMEMPAVHSMSMSVVGPSILCLKNQRLFNMIEH